MSDSSSSKKLKQLQSTNQKLFFLTCYKQFAKHKSQDIFNLSHENIFFFLFRTGQFTVPPKLSAAGGCSSSQVPPLSKVMTDRMLSSLTEPLMSVAMKTPRRPSTRWRSAKGSLAKYLGRREGAPSEKRTLKISIWLKFGQIKSFNGKFCVHFISTTCVLAS